MVNQATLGILLTMDDQASSKITNLGTTLSVNKMAIRELASGVSFLGTTFLGLGIALEKSQSSLAQNTSHFFMMVGGITAAIGSSVQFISAIAKVVDALRRLQIMQIITQAFSGPTGWISLGVGAGIAAGAIGGVAIMERNQSRSITIENKVLLDGRQVSQSVRRDIVLNQQRNSSSGIR